MRVSSIVWNANEITVATESCRGRTLVFSGLRTHQGSAEIAT